MGFGLATKQPKKPAGTQTTLPGPDQPTDPTGYEPPDLPSGAPPQTYLPVADSNGEVDPWTHRATETVNPLTAPADPSRSAPATGSNDPFMDLLRYSAAAHGNFNADGSAQVRDMDTQYWGDKLKEVGGDLGYLKTLLMRDLQPGWNPNAGSAAPVAMPSSGVANAAVNYGSSGAADPNTDPFKAIGGGVYQDGAWLPPGHPAIRAATATPTATPTAAGQPSNSPAAINDSYRQALADLLAEKDPSPEDLAKSQENRAYNLGAQRSEERQRAQLAEQAFAEGTDQSGAFDTDLQGIRQARGEGESQFLGGLASQKMQEHAQKIQFAIQMAQQSGQFDQAQQLQKQLAELQAQIQRESIASNNANTAAELGLRGQLGNRGLDLEALAQQIQNAQFNAQLGQNSDQFGKTLGFNYTQLGEQAQEAALRAIFGS